MIGGAGILLVAGALAADQDWLDRHFLPLFFFPREKILLQERLVRTGCGVLGLGLVFFVRPAILRAARRMTPGAFGAATARIVLAIGLAFGASELLLARKFAYAAAEGPLKEEPMRRPDPLLGWIFVPARQGESNVGGRNIVYATDPHGYRVQNGAAVDTDLPSILFTGESIMAGYGLQWDESIPAQVGALMHAQSANLAVHGYANDQAYLRLKTELPRFRNPVAVVSLFTPALFARNLGDDRPHLGPHLDWQPAAHRSRLSALFRFLVPYHSDADIEQGVAATRAVLRASAELAHRHHAVALVVDPQFGPEGPVERMLRRRILDEGGISTLRVELDPAWRLKGDMHPSPQAARVIALAIARRLRTP
ncbi:MAG TPA: hypothetical protein VLL04_01680 [Rhizomicrobium sp.]|nr:hypothetical protein [Rhizomicrobium sp.]